MNCFAPKLSIAVLAALVVFISVKLLKLYFTFPLIAIGALGIFLLLRKRKTLWHIEKEDGSRRVNIFVQTSGYLFMLLSIFTLFIGLAMTVVNIIYGLISRVEPNQAKKSLSGPQYIGDYLMNDQYQWETGGPLGYQYKANQGPIRSGVFFEDRALGVKHIVYDVTYTIDSNGNRKSVFENTHKAFDYSAVFIGGSFTFGEGLEDWQTLPSHFSSLTGYRSINLGMHGYGPHQGLLQLSDLSIYNFRVPDTQVKFIFYRSIPSHVERSAGISSWDKEGPCYSFDPSNSVVYRGSFRDCPRLASWQYLRPMLIRLSSSNEPWTASLAQKYLNPNPPKSSIENIKLYIGILRAINALAINRSSNFYILLDDIGVANKSGNYSCYIDVKAKELAESMSDASLKVFTISQALSDLGLKCDPQKLRVDIAYDHHPSNWINAVWAEFLKKQLNL